MKITFYILALAVMTSCGNTSKTAKDPIAQSTPTEAAPVLTEAASTAPTLAKAPRAQQSNMIVGQFQKEDLQEEPYSSWFNSSYESYSPSKEAMETIKKNISDYEIVAFMGTWCPDSRREVPHFFKILDQANYDLSKLKIIGVDRSKTTPDNLQEGHSIKRVPTFIFYKNGKEVNRYVEYAKESLAEDIAAIVSGREYKNSYAE
ncbi:thioredoxin family protein [Antarcticibacterium sp. 1MA-6-2]|uniref:thioredoxin family protein n=1 Tax=Antarcticibacterium sp. 1MA-6-2 TaxID=2908210 RepID=UPI001F359DCD|nr:thioredoxin family protein [Antarcticibacterium sp. 1MA-6-2]UJH91083.1 thioredoxin family protein [Antarcticibacterium sp. 1MA-6-2]